MWRKGRTLLLLIINIQFLLNTDCSMTSFPCHFRGKYLLENAGNGISKHPGFQMFWGGHAPKPPSILCLRRLVAKLPTFLTQPVTPKLTESTVYVGEKMVAYCLYKFFYIRISLFQKQCGEKVLALSFCTAQLSSKCKEWIGENLLCSQENSYTLRKIRL